jgi:hypothetical protein
MNHLFPQVPYRYMCNHHRDRFDIGLREVCDIAQAQDRPLRDRFPNTACIQSVKRQSQWKDFTYSLVINILARTTPRTLVAS